MGDEPLPKFTDRNRKKGKGKAEDDFINDGPIVIGESVRRKENSQEKNDCDKRLQEEKKKKRKPLEAASFEELLKMASKVSRSQGQECRIELILLNSNLKLLLHYYLKF